MCLAPGHNTVPLLGIEPRTSRFGVRHSTTSPLPSLFIKRLYSNLHGLTSLYLFLPLFSGFLASCTLNCSWIDLTADSFFTLCKLIKLNYDVVSLEMFAITYTIQMVQLHIYITVAYHWLCNTMTVLIQVFCSKC